MEDVYALWGELNEVTQGNHGDTAVYYGKDDGQKLYIKYDNEKNKVILITIDFTNMKG